MGVAKLYQRAKREAAGGSQTCSPRVSTIRPYFPTELEDKRDRLEKNWSIPDMILRLSPGALLLSFSHQRELFQKEPQ